MSEERRPRLIPPVWLLGTLLLQFALHRFIPLAAVVPAEWRWVGTALLVFGAGVVLYIGLLFRRHGTPIRPGTVSETLIVSGPYGFSRNPIYLAMMVALLGAAIRLGSVTPFLPIIGFFWIIESQFVAMEERMLLDRFGEHYDEYRNRVRRWL